MTRVDRGVVLYEVDGPIARIILNRPEKANAQSSDMAWQVDACLDDAEADSTVKVVVISDNTAGASNAANTPCTARAPNSQPGDCASPPSADSMPERVTNTPMTQAEIDQAETDLGILDPVCDPTQGACPAP